MWSLLLTLPDITTFTHWVGFLSDNRANKPIGGKQMWLGESRDFQYKCI